MDYRSKLGYSKGSPYANDPFIDIFSPEGLIDMSNTPFDLMGIDNLGNKKKMKAGRKRPYKFEGQVVREIPMQRGGFTDLFSYLFEEDEEEAQQTEHTAPSTDDFEDREKDLARREQQLMEDEEYNQAVTLALAQDNPFMERPVTPKRSYGPSTLSSSPSLTPDSYLTAIFGNEGGKTGIDPSNVRGTASGKYAIIEDGRKALYSKYYSNQMTYKEFDRRYNTDVAFEYDVARKLAEENLRVSKSPQEAIGRWYSPAHAQRGEWDVIPRPDYGNRLTVGQYVNRALKNIK